jgi:diadenylate cyclase
LELLKQILHVDLRAVIEVLFIAGFYYYLILFFRGTRGAAVLTGFLVVLAAMILITQILQLDTLNWILQRFSGILVVAFVVIFQPEIRRALAELGKQNVFSVGAADRSFIDHIVQAVEHLAERKIGAIIAVEREIGMRSIIEAGTSLDSRVTPELLATIFYPQTPLHDGGVVIRGDRVVAAGCVFPLSQRDELSKSLGTRHRAAIGVTEDTDAVVIVVSEETGSISLAFKGRLSRGLDGDRLNRMLGSILLRKKRVEAQVGAPAAAVDTKEDVNLMLEKPEKEKKA